MRSGQPIGAGIDRTGFGGGRFRMLAVGAVGVALAIIGASVTVLWVTDSFAEPSIVIDDPLIDMAVGVAIDGAVATPGLYELQGGSRVQHAVDAAGGLLPNADLASVNPALRLTDGERITIPTLAETPIAPEANAATAPAASAGLTAPAASAGLTAQPVTPIPVTPEVATGRIDLNSATQQELETLPGIGPAKAAAIIAYRTENGPFGSPAELENVEGISAEMAAELAPLVSVGS